VKRSKRSATEAEESIFTMPDVSPSVVCSDTVQIVKIPLFSAERRVLLRGKLRQLLLRFAKFEL
jgi:hypothetical protein